MNDKERIFDILLCEMSIKKIYFLHSEKHSIVCKQIIERTSNRIISVNELGFLDLVELFLEINTRIAFVQALHIACNTQASDYKRQRLLIHKILELAQKSGFFSDKEIYEMNFAAKSKCDECLTKESK